MGIETLEENRWPKIEPDLIANLCFVKETVQTVHRQFGCKSGWGDISLNKLFRSWDLGGMIMCAWEHGSPWSEWQAVSLLPHSTGSPRDPTPGRDDDADQVPLPQPRVRSGPHGQRRGGRPSRAVSRMRRLAGG